MDGREGRGGEGSGRRERGGLEEKDELMEALGALDEDGVITEEVVFDDTSTGTSGSKRTMSASSSIIDGGEYKATHEGEDIATAPTPSHLDLSPDGLDNMDALLAAADEDLGDMNLEDFDDDDDDDDLGDLEAMLNTT